MENPNRKRMISAYPHDYGNLEKQIEKMPWKIPRVSMVNGYFEG